MATRKQTLSREDLSPKDVSRFFSNVENGMWIGRTHHSGYGSFKFKHPDGVWRTIAAHVVSFSLEHGKVPKGSLVMHTCDEDHTEETGDNRYYRKCVNPKHLKLGTDSDNCWDKVLKGRDNVPNGDNHPMRLHPERVKRGEAHGMAKLSWNDVKTIRRLRASGLVYREIGEMYGVTLYNIFAICKGLTWKKRGRTQ